MKFIPAHKEDESLVAEILTDGTQYKAKLGDMAWGDEGWSEEEVQDAMLESTVYLIQQDEETIGTVSLQWDDTRNWGEQPPVAGYMHRLAIKDGFHNQGIGKLAVDWVAEQVAGRGRSLIRLDCEAKNTDLCSYYEKLGFVQVGTRPVPEYGDYVAALYERSVAD